MPWSSDSSFSLPSRRRCWHLLLARLEAERMSLDHVLHYLVLEEKSLKQAS